MNNLFVKTLYLFCLFVAFASCVDEKPAIEEEAHITVTTKATHHPGTGIDSDVVYFRILAFEKVYGLCVSNQRYGDGVNQIAFPITQKVSAHKEFDLVFIANEPATETASLNTIQSYDALSEITFPAAAFNSTDYIPMIGETNNVSTLPGTVPVLAEMTRLAARLDITLRSTKELNLFESIDIFNLPESVPLMIDKYNHTENRGESRSINLSDFVTPDPELTEDDIARGDIKWKRKKARVIIPSSYLSDANKEDEDFAIGFRVNFTGTSGEASRETYLEIKDDQEDHKYSLPPNTYLDFLATITDEIKLDVKVDDWDEVLNNWNVPGNRILNVSHTSTSITDFNGVRVTFQSNMPRVRVLPSLATGEDTNTVLNDLANPTKNADGTYSTTRFFYDPATGTGYMDILADGGKPLGTNVNPQLQVSAQTGLYTLRLVADDGNGGSALEREIDVDIQQNGLRFGNGDYRGVWQYAGAFFRNGETGERIITSQHHQDKPWTAEVLTGKDFIVLSSVPSFDPKVGTDNPGEAENFPVIPNSLKADEAAGLKVSGKGRIYFRIGTRDINGDGSSDDNIEPRYGRVRVTFYQTDEKTASTVIYVRQGEAADYIYRSEDVITARGSGLEAKFQPLVGQTRDAAVRLSPYNLTAPAYNTGNTSDFIQLSVNGGEFVKYPSQGGAFFQWGLRLDDATITANIQKFYRRAYNPYGNPKNSTSWISSKGYNKDLIVPAGKPYWYIMWGGTFTNVPQAFEEVFETCPPGYRRPTDGLTTEIMYNGPTPRGDENDQYRNQIADSELRVSLFTYPISGDANSNADLNTIWDPPATALGTYPGGNYGRKSVDNTYRSFYADGFFDRQPIVAADGSAYCVAKGTPNVAYGGLLFVHPQTYASLFLPSAGRISNDYADLGSRGSTGYYWSSSAAPIRSGSDYQGTSDKRTTNGAWSMEVQYDVLLFRNTYADFGQSIRCVKDE